MVSSVSRRLWSVCTACLLLVVSACGVDPIQAGQTCDDEKQQVCRTSSIAMYCRDGHWFERDCWVECRYLGFEVGSCGLHSHYGADTCMCAPDEVWAYNEDTGIGAECEHEGNQSCFSAQTLRFCLDGTVRQIDCRDACGTGRSSFCGYDPVRGDDSCICCDGPTCP